MGLLAWIIVGAIAGLLAGQVMRGRGFGFLGDIVIGIAGALVGGWLASVLLHISNPINGINVQSILIAFFGAVVVLFLIRAARVGRRRRYR
jgi:uncharacterized membrane protein YeaQ/YmgE (transglycosylase-associated protein family)